MFGKKVQAEALILDDEGAGHVTDTDFHGVHRYHHVTVSFGPESHKTEIHIEGDPRYDPKLIRARSKQERSAQAGALLNGRQPRRPGRGAPYRRRQAPVECARDLPRMRRPRRPVHRGVRRTPRVRVLREASAARARLQ